jgi:hypothetical protein
VSGMGWDLLGYSGMVRGQSERVLSECVAYEALTLAANLTGAISPPSPGADSEFWQPSAPTMWIRR